VQFVQRVSFVRWMVDRGVRLCRERRNFVGWIHCVRRVERRRGDVVVMVGLWYVVYWDGVGLDELWFCLVDVFASLFEYYL